jgi:hypothetical protein
MGVSHEAGRRRIRETGGGVMKKRFLVATLIAAAAAIVVTVGSYAQSQETSVRADMNSFQETPSVSSRGLGEFSARIDDEAQVIVYELTYAGLQGVVTQAHIHLGQRSQAGGVSVFLCGGGDKPPCPQAGTVTGVIDAADVIGPAAQGIEPGEIAELIRAIRLGHTYANVHSSNQPTDPPVRGFPGGEIRGQINDADQNEFDGGL